MKKLKIYLDTSIISFVYAQDAPEKQNITKEFFDKYLSSYNVYISDLVLTKNIQVTRSVFEPCKPVLAAWLKMLSPMLIG